MIELEAALARVRAAVEPLGAETVALGDAAGRFLAESVSATVDLPAFDNSAMDGYAVRADDVAQAALTRPVALRVAGRVAAGESAQSEVAAGRCVRVFTGSMLPPGADAVVMQEDTQADSGEPDVILVRDAIKPWENVRFRGEDVKRGARLVNAGDRVNIGRLALLAANGVATVKVGRRPLVGVIATGNELAEAGQTLATGQIYESNRVTLAAFATRAGAAPRLYPLAPDTLAATRSALEQAARECDVIVTSGGASVGELDFVKAAVRELGGELDFWRVAIKPGKPFLLGRCGGKPLFGLPGNPVSALVTFYLLVRPALLRMQGAADLSPAVSRGLLGEPLVNPSDRRHYERVNVDATGVIRSAGIQASHILGSLAQANWLVEVPPKTTLAEGALTTVLRWDD